MIGVWRAWKVVVDRRVCFAQDPIETSHKAILAVDMTLDVVVVCFHENLYTVYTTATGYGRNPHSCKRSIVDERMSTNANMEQPANVRKMTNDSSFELGQNDHVYDPRDSPRLTGYIGILISSIISFASCADVSSEFVDANERKFGIMFGAVSFFVTLLVVLLHYMQVGRELCIPKGSTLEGLCLTFLCLWWIPAVAYLTRVGGIAYQALNIYFFNWGGLICSMHTLNNFLHMKGYFSASHLASYNQALSGWIGLFFGSLVEFGSAYDASKKLDFASEKESVWAITLGAVSMTISFIVCLGHFTRLGRLGVCIHGTDCQLYLGFILVIWWTIGVAVLTDSGSIGSVLGLACPGDNEVRDWRAGSNMYFSLWFSFFSSCWVVVKFRGAHVQDLTLQPMSSPNRNNRVTRDMYGDEQI